MMFLHQKLGYRTSFITPENQEKELQLMKELFVKEQPKFTFYDTETTGLNIVTDKPFLYVFGFNKYVWAFEPTMELLDFMFNLAKNSQRLFAHNAQFDYHMTLNFGYFIPKDYPLADSMTVVRLTEYADSEIEMSLESVGQRYVDDEAKFAGKVIKARLNELNRKRKDECKRKAIEKFGKFPFAEVWERYRKRVQYEEPDEKDKPFFDFFDENYTQPNYYDVYLENPKIMINYAFDDVVIGIEYLKKALPTLVKVDEGLRTFNRECRLIQVIGNVERQGLRVNIDYLKECKAKCLDYRQRLYNLLYELTGERFTVGQHEYIKDMMYRLYGVTMLKCDIDALESIQTKNEDCLEVARTIVELRTVDKWISTYIDGKLNELVGDRFYTYIKNYGAVTGRVTSNMQQQPKEPLLDREGNELFHPRKCFIPDDDSILVFMDFSQMELRVQAYYTLLIGKGDVNMCRAYIPYKCYHKDTGAEFDYKNPEILAQWNSGEWIDPDTGEPWQAVDLHDVTTFKAFPHLNNDKNHPEFKKLRKLGKMCNFLKNYQGGKGAIMAQLKVSEEIADILDKAYYEAFPMVRDFQRWVNDKLYKYGFVQNLYGRRYYIRDSGNFYKACNYLVQGSCGDALKEIELKVDEYLEENFLESYILLPIHDELMLNIKKSELHIIPEIHEIMQHLQETIKWIPMISEVDYATTNWGEKKAYDETEIQK